MIGPKDVAAADSNAKGGQYVSVPGFASPGQSTPSHAGKAPGSTVIYSPKGWRWEEAGDDYSLAVSKLTGAAIEGAVRAVRSTFGTVFYIKGDTTTYPPFDGETVGATVRVQDAVTLDIVAEWSWDGARWVRMHVTSQQISNLDVGKLTAGSASIGELAARKIAGDVGRFLEITTDQLTVTGNASFTDVMARNIWSRVITAQNGEFEQIRAGMLAANSVSSDSIQVGALDGKVITGATIQSSNTSNRGIKINDDGLYVYDTRGNKTVAINAHNGEIEISGSVGRRDTWSVARFNDVVDRITNTDNNELGGKWGVGIVMESLEDDWWPGLVAISKASDGEPTLRMQAPIQKSKSSNSPYINLTPTAIAMYTPASGSSYASFSLSSGGVFTSAKGWWMNATDQSISYGNSGNTALFVSSDQYRVRPSSWSSGGLWGNGTNVVMEYSANNQVWIGSDGVHITGTKKFTMRVPGETRRRGLWLDHSATESPYDGIEYWESVRLDDSGHATWTLPDYVPKIASKKAPWVVLTSSDAKAELVQTGFGADAAPWTVEVSGEPGSMVSVLVKGARMIDIDMSDDGEPVMRDYARESPWHLGPQSPEDVEQGVSFPGGYGPAQPPNSEEDDGQA